MERLRQEAERRAKRAAEAAAAEAAAEEAELKARRAAGEAGRTTAGRDGAGNSVGADGRDDRSPNDGCEEDYEEEEADGEVDGDAEGEGEGEDAGDAGAAAEEDDWEDDFVCPLTVRFTQEKIHPFFYRRGPIVNVLPKIRPVVHARGSEDEILELVPPFGPIHCIRKGEEFWSLDNRRLYALQLAAMEQWPRRCHVRVLRRDRLPRRKFKTQYRKLSTTSEGRSVELCTRFQQFDTWSWFERAIELEWYRLSQLLGTVLSVFEAAPVVGALLFRTGLTGLTSRVPLVVAFLLAFAVDFTRQKVALFERRLCELQVIALMEGEVGQLYPCGRRETEDGETNGISPVQLAAVMALSLLLVLPYIFGLPPCKLRSSLFSCWLGIACVLAAQLGSSLRHAAAAGSEYTGAERRLTPKHRD